MKCVVDTTAFIGKGAMKSVARRSVFLYAIMAYFTLCGAGDALSWIDSMESIYASASRDYDSISLMNAARSIDKRPLMDRQSPRALLIRGLIYWRMELIAYCSNEKVRLLRYGSIALSTLNEAEKAGVDPYLTSSHRAFACQLIAGLGISKGAIYGPRSAAETKKARLVNPQGYFTLLATAVNASQAPSFAGGNPKKAVVLLEKMEQEFPDSIDVKIHLARAYRRSQRLTDARAVIQPIIQSHPKNLLARMIWAETMAQ